MAAPYPGDTGEGHGFDGTPVNLQSRALGIYTAMQQALDSAFVAAAPYHAKEPMHVSVLYQFIAFHKAVQHLARVGWAPDALTPSTAEVWHAARAFVTKLACKTFPPICRLLCETLGQPPTDDADVNANWRPKLLRETILLVNDMTALRVLRAVSLASALDTSPHAALDCAMAAFAATSIPTIAVYDRSVLTDMAHVLEGLPTARAHAAWFAVLLAH
ncbi:hypothetical protein AMAG_10875 [Allomyces macrogynus ATCC 38327]|uniref:Uncharacterized protein n=1 Tax=Allomyces macrogynus (strain ATCC 38327) TaxID=578462 RepID=A0A0L0SS89_ALLM3|nr:hypothetical protein AMAG_10875 [Allomyces macrogynus ATCC 38327]|eukprot:KNE65230.1 hypothetical protein AMAG_10875 [Allomyces macrogynus ATCC 38327]